MGRKKHTLEYVENYFRDHNCRLIETEYINAHYKMKYICSCGEESKINFNNFKTGRRCNKCGTQKAGDKRKHTFEYIKNIFISHGCELLETKFINAATKMKYRCSCGNISKIKFSHFQDGHRCHECSISKRSGKNHPLWNPLLTDEDREKNKSRTSDFLYNKWRTKVYQRDKYLCQRCYQKGKYLNAHHIESWDINKKLRLLESNGITFCEDCHKEFHKKYGWGNNSTKQLNEFLNIQIVKVG